MFSSGKIENVLVLQGECSLRAFGCGVVKALANNLWRMTEFSQSATMQAHSQPVLMQLRMLQKYSTSHPSNSGIKVLNINAQRNLKCSTAGEGSTITGGSCTNAAASATDVSGGVTGSSNSGGNSGIVVINKSDQSGLTCSTAGSTAPIDTGSCSNSASSGTTVSGGVAH